MEYEHGYIDCHCHLSAPAFDHDREEVIQRAKESGVKAIVVVTEFYEEFQKTIDLCKKHEGFLFPCIGVHPVQPIEDSNWSRSAVVSDMEHLDSFVRKNECSIVGVGEVGLDFMPRYVRTPEDKEGQRQVLRDQIKLAKDLDLPINVHSRSAGRPTIHLLKEENVKSAVLHAFDGRASHALEGAKQGYYFSVPPCIVASEQKQKLVKALPLESLLLETDSPVLGPNKNIRNEPGNIRFSCEAIAKIKKVSVETVMKVTSENAFKLFPKLKSILLK